MNERESMNQLLDSAMTEKERSDFQKNHGIHIESGTSRRKGLNTMIVHKAKTDPEAAEIARKMGLI